MSISDFFKSGRNSDRLATMKSTALTIAALVATILGVHANAQVIVGHRGASYDAPENTLASYRLCWEQNADGGEGDFYLTRDGKIVCIHDPTTKRTGNVDLDVAKSNFADLRKVDVGSFKSAAFAGEKIPTINEVLAAVPTGKMYYIEIKCGPEILPGIEEAIKRSKLKPEQLRIISFNAQVIAESKKRMPQIKAHWISGFKEDKKTGAITPTREKVLQTLDEIKADGFNAQANMKMLTPDFIKQLQAKGLEVAVWTVDDPAVARQLKAMGVWGLTTNRPAFLREQLASGK
jgi:glycerophosphoryl diester phosphodiesterase